MKKISKHKEEEEKKKKKKKKKRRFSEFIVFSAMFIDFCAIVFFLRAIGRFFCVRKTTKEREKIKKRKMIKMLSLIHI